MKKWMLADLALGMSIAVAAYKAIIGCARLQAALQQQPVARHRRARMRAGRTTQAALPARQGPKQCAAKWCRHNRTCRYEHQPIRGATCGRTRTGNIGGSTTSGGSIAGSTDTRCNRDTRSKTVRQPPRTRLMSQHVQAASLVS
jgi:hypothetical protein